MGSFDTFPDAAVVTKSDTADNTFAAFYIGGTGNLNVVTERGTTVLFSAIPVGTFIRIRTSKVLSTSTTATLIVGFKK